MDVNRERRFLTNLRFWWLVRTLLRSGYDFDTIDFRLVGKDLAKISPLFI